MLWILEKLEKETKKENLVKEFLYIEEDLAPPSSKAPKKEEDSERGVVVISLI